MKTLPLKPIDLDSTIALCLPLSPSSTGSLRLLVCFSNGS